MYLFYLVTRPGAGEASEIDEPALTVVDPLLLVDVEAPELAVRADADGLDVLIEAVGYQAKRADAYLPWNRVLLDSHHLLSTSLRGKCSKKVCGDG